MSIEEKKNSQIFQDSNHLSPTSELEVSELIKEAYKKKFPIVTLLKNKTHKNSGSIILNASNEILVERFIRNKISFNAIYQCLKQLFKDRDFNKYAIKKTPNVNEIYKIDKWARRKTLEIIDKRNR